MIFEAACVALAESDAGGALWAFWVWIAGWSWWMWLLVCFGLFVAVLFVLLLFAFFADQKTAYLLDALVCEGALDAALAAEIANSTISHRRKRDLAVFAAEGMPADRVRALLKVGMVY